MLEAVAVSSIHHCQEARRLNHVSMSLWINTNTALSSFFSVENRPGFTAVELRLSNYYYDVLN